MTAAKKWRAVARLTTTGAKGAVVVYEPGDPVPPKSVTPWLKRRGLVEEVKT